jgi:hypothetical protein
VKLPVSADPEVNSAREITSAERAQRLTLPVTVNGRLWDPNAGGAVSHFYRFHARRGDRIVMEVMARRLGSRLDPEIELLDRRGNPVERALLRAVGRTEVTLSDRDSASSGIRLQAWDDFHINDYLLAGREVIRIEELPKGPDDDVRFRSLRGQRLGYLGTTPEYHSIGAPVYKVEIHRPGARFSPNGYPLTRIGYRNDDGGPLYGKDAYLDFVAPRDDDYVLRLSDPRGHQGEEFAYRLMIHAPRPEYRLSMSPEHPNIPSGGGAIVEIACERFEGFDGEIEARLEGLPAGFSATGATIERGEQSATLQISAAADAVTPAPWAAIRVVGTARIGGALVTRAVEPPGGVRLLAVLPRPDLRAATNAREVVIRPGEEASLEALIDRQGEFGGRVPIEVRNLPFGVRVQNVGLNGVLVTEQDDSRRFSLFCEPWVRPQTRLFYVIGVVEGGVNSAAAPLTLRVEPRPRSTPSRSARR